MDRILHLYQLKYLRLGAASKMISAFPFFAKKPFLQRINILPEQLQSKEGRKRRSLRFLGDHSFFCKSRQHTQKLAPAPHHRHHTHIASAYIHLRITARSKNSLHEVPDRQSVPPPQLGAAQLGFTAVSSICKILSPSNLRVPNQSVCFSQECMPLFIHLQLVAF